MMQSKINRLAYLAFSFALVNAVNAEESRWLIGVEAGQSNYGGSCNYYEFCKDNTTVLGGYLGYQLSEHTRFKVGYYDFGSSFDGDHTPFWVDVSGIAYGYEGDITLGDTSWRLGLELGGMSYFIRHEQESNGSSKYVSAHDFTPYVGVGLHYQYDDNLRFSLMGRHYGNIVESKWDTFNSHINTVGLGVSYRFGSKPKATGSYANSNESKSSQTMQHSAIPVVISDSSEYASGYEMTHEIYFETGSDFVTEVQFEQFSERLGMCSNGVRKIDVQGYADKSGDADFNQLLSFARAESVIERILSTFKDVEITSSAHGERFSTAKRMIDRKVIVTAFCL